MSDDTISGVRRGHNLLRWRIVMNHESIISLLKEEDILDDDTLQSVIEKHESTGQSVVSILKNDRLVNDDQLVKIVALKEYQLNVCQLTKCQKIIVTAQINYLVKRGY